MELRVVGGQARCLASPCGGCVLPPVTGPEAGHRPFGWGFLRTLSNGFVAWEGLLALALIGCATGSGPAAAPAAPAPYLRVQRTAEGAATLEIAARSFRPASRRGPVVWLVGATHLGSRDYYFSLQRFLERQEVVLFEGVGADGAPFPRGGGSGDSIQKALANALGLQYQLEAMDYTRPHFRHSDLSLEQLRRLLAGAQVADGATGKASGGESGATVAPAPGEVEFRQLMQVMQGTGLLGGLARLGVALMGSSARLQAAAKLAFIELLGQTEGKLPELDGVSPGLQRLAQVLIEERNRRVLSDLEEVLGLQPAPASVALFYGTGHMVHLEEHLRNRLGSRPFQELWFGAFGVDPRAVGLSALEIGWVERIVRGQLRSLGVSGPAPGLAPAPAGSR